jgi:hypothetical protein
VTKLICLIAALFSLTVSPAWAATPFEPGQVWAYDSRASESESRVLVVRIDSFPKAGRIVHIAVVGLRLQRTPTGSVETWQIGHARLSEKALRKSVTTLDPSTPVAIPAGFEEQYQKWKAAADSGDIQYWHLPLRDIVQQMEKWIQSGKS